MVTGVTAVPCSEFDHVFLQRILFSGRRSRYCVFGWPATRELVSPNRFHPFRSLANRKRISNPISRARRQAGPGIRIAT